MTPVIRALQVSDYDRGAQALLTGAAVSQLSRAPPVHGARFDLILGPPAPAALRAGYLQLLGQLTTVGSISKQAFEGGWSQAAWTGSALAPCGRPAGCMRRPPLGRLLQGGFKSLIAAQTIMCWWHKVGLRACTAGHGWSVRRRRWW